jgi:superoxide dismutase, Cu-Zn family
MRRAILSLLAVGALTATAHAQDAKSATAELHNAKGEVAGRVALRDTPNGVWLNVSISSLPPGSHGFHIHETGKCEGDFKSAGGHFAPAGNKHGFLVDGGPHAGDMPNIHVPSDGRLNFEVFAPAVTLDEGAEGSLFDSDGSAIMVHSGGDDYKSQPSGDAGSRIACGVVTNKTVK